MSAAVSGALAKVAVIEEEVVRPGGASKVSWLVRYNDGWVRAGSHPTAVVEKLDRGSGIVWRMRITLALARGTELARVETRPDLRVKSALAYLTGPTRGAKQQTLRRAYLVGPDGTVVPAEK